MNQIQKAKRTVFVLEMEHNVRELTRRWMLDEGHHVLVFQDASTCLSALGEQHPPLLIADVLTASLAGIDIVERSRALHRSTRVVLVYQQRLTDTALRSVQQGAFDYLLKPMDRGRLILSVKNALHLCALEAENRQLRMDIAQRRRSSIPAAAGGNSLSMRELEKKAIRDALAATKGNVSKAARNLGLGRTTLYRKMSAFGLDVERSVDRQ